MTYRIYRNFFDPKPIEKFLQFRGKSVPGWLGNFEFETYGTVYGKKLSRLPHTIREFTETLAFELCPEQDFNTVFLQKYLAGRSVKKHRDPTNNVGYTIIAVLGEFEGAETTLYLSPVVKFKLNAGDVLLLACTIEGVQGCPHEVSEVLSGTRYAVILNTIETSNKSDTLPLVDTIFPE